MCVLFRGLRRFVPCVLASGVSHRTGTATPSILPRKFAGSLTPLDEVRLERISRWLVCSWVASSRERWVARVTWLANEQRPM
ncbi:hypothetical protein DFH07DRAFT_850789 [Mycena maculata]|uniref:Uncharacterized protein n=1 Tax=Mycena maculata TaxID=230809 RepID=A0AAD7HWM7_9AGAR|nr:hypothetical protein DFH07DRAFT_850789 [Mycena maculata]